MDDQKQFGDDPKSLETIRDLLKTAEMAFESNILLFDAYCPDESAKEKAKKLNEKALSIVKQSIASLNADNLAFNLKDLFYILNNALLANKVVIKDPNRIRYRKPVIYSHLNKMFPLDATEIDKANDQIVINVRPSRGGTTRPKKLGLSRKGLILPDQDLLQKEGPKLKASPKTKTRAKPKPKSKQTAKKTAKTKRKSSTKKAS